MPTQTQQQSRKKGGGSDLLKKEFDHSELLRIVSVFALVAIVIVILAGLFAPGLRYELMKAPSAPVDAQAFLNELEPLTGSKITHGNRIQVLENGENFYKAELAVMREARHSINIEAYIFHQGKVTAQVLEVLTERAKAGVQVNLVIDSVGSLSTRKSYFRRLTQAGGQVGWYHPLRIHNWFITNNRTHREMTIVDGSVAFVGGAGYADWWEYNLNGDPRWRDTMVRVEGPAVRQIQGAFSENWLATSGKIIDGEDYFPAVSADAVNSTGLVVSSSPPSGGPTHARVLFQTLIAAAHKSIQITTPYFLPDRSMSNELVKARMRGVKVTIVVPGEHSDHAVTRSSGRGAYGDLLKAGAEIYEYEKSMIHAKTMVIDGVWSVVGSANLDSRSFGINDEVNLAILDAEVAATLQRGFEDDMSHARRVSLDQWENRSIFERMMEWVGWVFERQQ